MGVAKKKKNDVVLRIVPPLPNPIMFEQQMQCRIMSSRWAWTVQYIIHAPEMMVMMMLGILRKKHISFAAASAASNCQGCWWCNKGFRRLTSSSHKEKAQENSIWALTLLANYCSAPPLETSPAPALLCSSSSSSFGTSSPKNKSCFMLPWWIFSHCNNSCHHTYTFASTPESIPSCTSSSSPSSSLKRKKEEATSLP